MTLDRAAEASIPMKRIVSLPPADLLNKLSEVEEGLKGHFAVLLTAYRVERDESALREIREATEGWLTSDPTAYWALELITREYRDAEGHPLKLLSSEEPRAYLKVALSEAPTQLRPG